MTDAKRTKSIKIRVTDDELAALRERCPAGELAPWLRDLGLGQKRPRRAERVDPALLRQLAGAGNLLNQIARRIHTGQWSYGDRVEILAALRHIEQRLAEINANAG
ncbi:mobilization protein MobC [Shigella sonnei]|uniref:MobC family plasmid mobilization relaxosome protein n=1 Tax=Shigella sonnei TaxID=624 RepID=UPI000972EB37|nr:MobC family plasmid mobilization relaxosome protein [Shigella sonnei]SIY93997.1 mobilization protein MobC [Shigella sonnei]SIZ48998.1 mobilization protein MobC [Shigella sonnei]